MLNVRKFSEELKDTYINPIVKIRFWGTCGYDAKAEYVKKEILKKYPKANIVLEKDKTTSHNFIIESNEEIIHDKVKKQKTLIDETNIGEFMKKLDRNVEKEDIYQWNVDTLAGDIEKHFGDPKIAPTRKIYDH